MNRKLVLSLGTILMLIAGCGQQPCNHFDNDKNHYCDSCGEKLSEHDDKNKDHLCDLCSEKLSEHLDSNKDHICDYCEQKLTDHADENKDHFCDYCEQKISEHIDQDKNYICDICGEDLTPIDVKAKQVFNNLVSSIKTNHNYRLEISSEVEGWEEIDNYYDSFINYNNLAIESKDFEYGLDGVGKIYQKDQGFVSYYRSGSSIAPVEFVSTNPNLKISDFNDVIAENLFFGNYFQDNLDPTKFVTDDINSIAVASNFSGFADYIPVGMFQPDNSMSAFIDIEKNEIIINLTYWLMYFDIIEHTDKALLTITIKDIGKVSSNAIESYIENPSYTFVAPTEFSDADKAVLLEEFTYKTPVFPTGASYAYSLDIENYDGFYYATITDKNSGDLRESYGNQLLNDGFSLTSTDTYSKITFGDTELQKITHKIFMKYFEPNDVYPNGVMKIYCRSIDDVNIFFSIDEFNYYLNVKKYDELVPALPAEDTCIKISNVKDTTHNDSETYALKMNLTDTFRVYIPSFSNATAFASAYGKLLIKKGYSDKSKALSMTNYTYADSKSTTYVAVDVATTEGQYPGYVGIRYVVYKVDEESLRAR